MPAFCPFCGVDQALDAPVTLGALFIDPKDTVIWLGRKVALLPQQRLLVWTLVKAKGEVVRREVLMNRIGTESPKHVQVVICNANKAFHAIYPAFDKIQLE